MPVEIEILSGPRQGERLLLDGGGFFAGDKPADEVYFSPDTHPESIGNRVFVSLEDDGWRIQCLSGEAVLVNHTPLEGRRTLRSGDIVRMTAGGPDFSFAVVGQVPFSHLPVGQAALLAKAERPKANSSAQASSGDLRPPLAKANGTGSVLRYALAAMAAAAVLLLLWVSTRRDNGQDNSRTAPRLKPIADQVIPEGQLLSLSPELVAPTDETEQLVYRLQGEVPDGMRVDPQLGRITWQTAEKDGPGQYNVIVQVAYADARGASPDESSSPGQTSFSVRVEEVNQPPTVAALASQTIEAGEPEAFSLQIAASDPDEPAAALLYRLESDAPLGMSIDERSGRLTWTPSLNDAGQAYDVNIVVGESGSQPLSTSATLHIDVTLPAVWQRVAEKAGRATYLVALEDARSGTMYPFATAFAIEGKTLLTSATAATEMARRMRSGWRAWLIDPSGGPKSAVEKFEVVQFFSDLAEEPQQRIFFDLALVTAGRSLEHVLEIAPPGEVHLLRQQPIAGFFGFSHGGEPFGGPSSPAGSPITGRAAGPSPSVSRTSETEQVPFYLPRLYLGKFSELIPLDEEGGSRPGAPQLLAISGRAGGNLYGSPLLNVQGEVVAIYAEQAHLEGQPQPLHYAALPTLASAWLAGQGKDLWAPLPVSAESVSSPPEPREEK